MVRVLVTGGAGFIGSNLVDELLVRGHDVRVLDNFSTGHRHNLAEAELIEGDLRSYERVHHAVRGCEVVFHQGALPSVPRSVQDPLTTSEINIGGTLNVLLTARDQGVRRVVFASSSSIYGDAPGFPRREGQSPAPLAPYAVSKLAAEQYCRIFATVYGLETVSLRYFNVFGRHQDPTSQYSAVIPRFIAAVREGRAPTIYGSGEQSRDFTHVDDVVAANILAMDAPGAVGPRLQHRMRYAPLAEGARHNPQPPARFRRRTGARPAPGWRRRALLGRHRSRSRSLGLRAGASISSRVSSGRSRATARTSLPAARRSSGADVWGARCL